MRRWAENFFYDFEGDYELLEAFNNVISTMEASGDSAASILKKALLKGVGMTSRMLTIQRGLTTTSISSLTFSNPPPKPILPKNTLTNVLDADPIEIARQLTILVMGSIHD